MSARRKGIPFRLHWTDGFVELAPSQQLLLLLLWLCSDGDRVPRSPETLRARSGIKMQHNRVVEALERMQQVGLLRPDASDASRFELVAPEWEARGKRKGIPFRLHWTDGFVELAPSQQLLLLLLWLCSDGDRVPRSPETLRARSGIKMQHNRVVEALERMQQVGLLRPDASDASRFELVAPEWELAIGRRRGRDGDATGTRRGGDGEGARSNSGRLSAGSDLDMERAPSGLHRAAMFVDSSQGEDELSALAEHPDPKRLPNSGKLHSDFGAFDCAFTGRTETIPLSQEEEELLGDLYRARPDAEWPDGPAEWPSFLVQLGRLHRAARYTLPSDSGGWGALREAAASLFSRLDLYDHRASAGQWALWVLGRRQRNQHVLDAPSTYERWLSTSGNGVFLPGGEEIARYRVEASRIGVASHGARWHNGDDDGLTASSSPDELAALTNASDGQQ